MRKLLVILFLFSVSVGYSQRLNLTHFDNAPLWFNPAYTGLANCNKIGGIFRNQWIQPTSNKSYKTIFLYGTYNLPSASASKSNNWFIPQDWVSIGGFVYHDKAGDGELTTNSARLSSSIHFGELNKARRFALSIGMGAGISNKYIDFGNLYFNSQWDNYEFNTDLPSYEPYDTRQFSNYYYNIDLGVNLTIQPLFKNFAANLGVSINNFNHPVAGLYEENRNAIIDTRIVFHGDYTSNLFKKSQIKLFTTHIMDNTFTNTIVGFKIYTPDFMENIRYGLSYRTDRDVILTVDYSYQNWDFKIAYEINHQGVNKFDKLTTASQVCVIKSFGCNNSYSRTGIKRIISGRGYKTRSQFKPIQELAKRCSDGIYKKPLFKKGDNLLSFGLGVGRILETPDILELSLNSDRNYMGEFSYLYFLHGFYAVGLAVNYLRLSNTNFIPFMVVNRLNVRIGKVYLYADQSFGYAFEIHDNMKDYMFNEVGGFTMKSALGYQLTNIKGTIPFIELGFNHQASKIYYAYIHSSSQVVNEEVKSNFNMLYLKAGFSFN